MTTDAAAPHRSGSRARSVVLTLLAALAGLVVGYLMLLPSLLTLVNTVSENRSSLDTFWLTAAVTVPVAVTVGYLAVRHARGRSTTWRTATVCAVAGAAVVLALGLTVESFAAALVWNYDTPRQQTHPATVGLLFVA